MLTYIIRRLLLMIPTLVGITLLVFMLLALSPGGIGASLRVAGGQMEASKAAFRPPAEHNAALPGKSEL